MSDTRNDPDGLTIPASDEESEGALELLEVYLNDHYAAARGGIDLLDRTLANNEDNELAERLRPIRDEVARDREELEALIDRLGFEVQHYKEIGASVAETLGRLKPNRELTGYSDLSRLLELEGLCSGITAKLGMWRALRTVEDTDPRIAETDLAELIERGERQLEQVESFRGQAARVAFGPDRSADSEGG
jgi:hypothetical protein